MTDSYTYELVDSVDAVDAGTWQRVCAPTGNPFLDLRFLRAVENSFGDEAQFWYAICRDERGEAVACTCFSRYLVDCALMAPAGFQRLVEGVRRLWRNFFKHNILLCGVPVSTCNNQLAIADGADMQRLAALLNELALQLARDSKCGLISFKEFAPPLAGRVSAMERYGFMPARSVVAYHLEGDFGSFDNYLAGRSKRTRANIRRYFRNFEAAGLTCEQLRGRDGIEQIFTDEVHSLYLNVLNRAKVKFERIPVEFFRQLAKQFPDEACFTIIRKAGKIVAFCCGLASPGAHTMLFCGLDYSLNAEADLYFNIIYRGLAQGLAPDVQVVHIGAAADEFKQRMGCVGEALSIYVRAVGAVQNFLLRQVFGLLFDTTPLPAQPTIPMEEVATEPADVELRPAA